MDERRLERALRQGPPYATRYVPAHVAIDEWPVAGRRAGSSRLVLLLAVTALLMAGMLASLVASGAFTPRRVVTHGNGWVAFTVWDGELGSGPYPDRDIELVRDGVPPRRIIGTDSDNLDQICPAFSPDGRRLAFGQAEGRVSDDVPYESAYRNAALVIVDVDAEGNTSSPQTIEIGGSYPPPCAVWSADGRHVAFGVSMTGWRSATVATWDYAGDAVLNKSALESAVWVVTVADGRIDVIPDVFATDLEWSPVAGELAMSRHVPGDTLRQGGIGLYAVGTGDVRPLEGPVGVSSLSWSPDGERIAYQRTNQDGRQEIRVAEVDESGDYQLTSDFNHYHGRGPAWSPTGEWIVYQRGAGGGPEATAATLIPAGGEFANRELDEGEVVVPLHAPGLMSPFLPFRISWSPDGQQLLCWGWDRSPGQEEALIAVPIDSDLPAVVLYQPADGQGFVVGHGEGMVPTQAWARDE